MAPDETSETAAAEAETPAEDAPGVFGNLPKTRPGARSPRRDAVAPPKAERARPAPPPPPPPRTPPAASRDDGQEAAPAGGGIEDIAWAGVAAAAEAATIGVRLATRALEAMRDTVDRR